MKVVGYQVDCTIFKIAIEYDNKLMNNSDLFNYCVSNIGLDQVVDLSYHLTSDLISESIDTNDYDIVIAGLISLMKSN